MPPSVRDVQTLCQRVRPAGSPAAKARSRLVAEYERLCEALGHAPAEVKTGLDLQRAAAMLLRVASEAEVAAASDPLERLRRLRRGG